jgi:predicted ester cyclase
MAHQIYADKVIEHDGYGDRTIGPNGKADEMSETHTDFSGWSEHPETLVAEVDYVAVRSWAGGKQVKDLAAVPPGPAVPNKGRSLRMQESLMFRIADGKVAERWVLNGA